ncbi:MAG: hypothetical protein JXJ04_14280 [Spirochaetales bacterium]|nr:hypothetical protein [Spirochaetales bacterium]
MSTISNRNRGLQPKIPVRIAVIVALAVCVAIAYIPVIGAGWVYDDVNLVKPSPALKDFAGLIRSISTDLYSQAAPRLEVSAYWRPLAMTSYWLDTRFGDPPGALHVGNIIIHALAAALLALVVMRRHGGIAGIIAAGIASAWWALHPVNVEPVAWISTRYDLLCGVGLLCLLAIPWRPGPLRAAIFGLVFLAGLFSKEGFGVMAAVVIAMDFADQRPVRAAAPRWAAVVLALVLWIILRAIVGVRSFDFPPFEAILRILLIYPEAIAIYTWRALVPTALTISHPYAPGGVLGVLAGAAIFIALAAVVLLPPRKSSKAKKAEIINRRRLSVPVAIFLVGLVPMAGAMALFHEAPERYFYLPSIGLALLAGELVFMALSARRRLVRILVPAVFGVVIVIGLVRVEQRLPDWRSDDTLWSAALRVNPLDPLANHYRAIAAGRLNRWSVALRAIEIAAKGDPNSSRFATTYAWVLIRTDDFAGAVREAERATNLAPYQPDGWYYLAFARHRIGDHKGELFALVKLLEVAPNYPGAREMYEVAACEVSGRTDCLEGR